MRIVDGARASLLVCAIALFARPILAQEEEETDSANLPAGHPQVGAPGSAQGAQGSAHGGGGASSQIFQPPADTSDEDPRIPPGTISVTILDAENAPVANTAVTLGILHNSVAMGESREHKLATTDGNGSVSFANLEHVSGVAYRVSVVEDAGTFWASPFGLSADKGMRVTLHVYPVTRDIEKALIVSQVVIYAEMKDDRVQLEQAITIYNLGRVAWVPDGVMLGLPAEFTALNGQDSMTGDGVTSVEKKGALLHGTFGPGQHVIDFRWQLPYAGEKDVSFDEKLIPHVAVMRVMAAASQEMKLVVSGFPDAEPRTDAQGERILITERQLRRDEAPLTRVHVDLHDLPTPGPGRVIATLLAGLSVLAGLGYAFSSRKTETSGEPSKEERARLLEELEELELARRGGEIGPKTHERRRRELIDAIARTLVSRTAVE
jgi:hypothetical protein